jgi:hypothetical protein
LIIFSSTKRSLAVKTKLIFLVLCTIAAGFGTTSYSQQPQSAPVNPAFIRYMEKQAQAQAAPLLEAEHSFGHIPSPIDVRSLLGTNQARTTARMVGAA